VAFDGRVDPKRDSDWNARMFSTNGENVVRNDVLGLDLGSTCDEIGTAALSMSARLSLNASPNSSSGLTTATSNKINVLDLVAVCMAPARTVPVPRKSVAAKTPPPLDRHGGVAWRRR
jgi:hypothetical protein